MRRGLVLVWLLAAAGCASWFRATIPPASTPVEPASSASVFTATAAELAARGYRIAISDPASGTIQTETQVMPGTVPCGFIQCAYRDTIHVTVTPQGAVSVRVQRELSTFWVASTPNALMGGTRWEPPASTQRSTVAGVAADQDALLGAIIQRAGIAAPGAGAAR